jgi:glycine betaine/choline ABC-type transport system substrate-binding protein
MKRSILVLCVAVFAALALVLTGCGQTPSNQPTGGTSSTTGTSGASGSGSKGPIRVGSKIDVEGPVLGNIIIAMLEKNGFTVEDKTRTGATDVVRKALLSGEIDVYPEYTANAILLFHKGAETTPRCCRARRRRTPRRSRSTRQRASCG